MYVFRILRAVRAIRETCSGALWITYRHAATPAATGQDCNDGKRNRILRPDRQQQPFLSLDRYSLLVPVRQAIAMPGEADLAQLNEYYWVGWMGLGDAVGNMLEKITLLQSSTRINRSKTDGVTCARCWSHRPKMLMTYKRNESLISNRWRPSTAQKLHRRLGEGLRENFVAQMQDNARFQHS